MLIFKDLTLSQVGEYTVMVNVSDQHHGQTQYELKIIVEGLLEAETPVPISKDTEELRQKEDSGNGFHFDGVIIPEDKVEDDE